LAEADSSFWLELGILLQLRRQFDRTCHRSARFQESFVDSTSQPQFAIALVALGNGHDPIAGLDRLFRAVVFDDQREVELDRLPQRAVAGVHVRHAEQVLEHLSPLWRDRLILGLILGRPWSGRDDHRDDHCRLVRLGLLQLLKLIELGSNSRVIDCRLDIVQYTCGTHWIAPRRSGWFDCRADSFVSITASAGLLGWHFGQSLEDHSSAQVSCSEVSRYTL